MKTKELLKKIEQVKARSAWDKGVKLYAYEILESIETDELPSNRIDMNVVLLNGAGTWRYYSWGGNSLIYDEKICKRLCSPSEQKKRKYGKWRPNQYEDWLDVQARALYQAFRLVCRAAGI